MKEYSYQSSSIFNQYLSLLPGLTIFFIGFKYYALDERLFTIGLYAYVFATILYVFFSYFLIARRLGKERFVLDSNGLIHYTGKGEKHLKWDEISKIEKTFSSRGNVLLVHSSNYKPIKIVMHYVLSAEYDQPTIDELYDDIEEYRAKALKTTSGLVAG